MGTIVSVVIGVVVAFFFVILFAGMLSAGKPTKYNGFVWGRTLANFRYKHSVEWVIRDDRPRESLSNIAEVMFNDHIKGKEFLSALQGYIDLCSTIEHIRCCLFGNASCHEGVLSEDRADDLIVRLESIFAEKFHFDDTQIGVIERLINPHGFFSIKPDWHYEKTLGWLKSSAEHQKTIRQIERSQLC